MASFDKIKELAKDKAFVEGLLKNQSPEEAKAYLAEHGVEMSLDEVKELGAELYAMSNGESELAESDLAAVAGGAEFDSTDELTNVKESLAKVWEWIKSW